MLRLVLSEMEALAVLAALETWQDSCPTEALEATVGRLTAHGLAAPYASATEALEARYGPIG